MLDVECSYTMCFIKKNDEILLLNREKPAWMGRWNGLGGKIEPGETPHESALREVKEEAGLHLKKMDCRGRLIWILEDGKRGGMYLYWAELPADRTCPTPTKTDEGILDWKRIAWILHPENKGMSVNVVKCLPILLADKKQHLFQLHWRGEELIAFDHAELSDEEG